MTAEQWATGRGKAGLTQVAAARALDITQPYLSQLETGLRAASAGLLRRAAKLYKLPASALPLPEPLEVQDASPDDLQGKLAAIGYPGFERVRSKAGANPAELVLAAVVKRDLDARLVEALPWVLSAYPDLNWEWLRDRVKLQNAQTGWGTVAHLAEQSHAHYPSMRRLSARCRAGKANWKRHASHAKERYAAIP